MDKFRKTLGSSPVFRAAALRTGPETAAQEELLNAHRKRICAALHCSASEATDIYLDILDLVQSHTSAYDPAVREAMLREAWRLWSIVALDERRGVVAGLHAVDHWLRSPLQL